MRRVNTSSSSPTIHVFHPLLPLSSGVLSILSHKQQDMPAPETVPLLHAPHQRSDSVSSAYRPAQSSYASHLDVDEALRLADESVSRHFKYYQFGPFHSDRYYRLF